MMGSARDGHDGPRVVIGLGNPFRRDDGAGHAVVERVAAGLRSVWGPGAHERGEDAPARVLLLDGEPSRLIEAWTGASLAVVVDAVRSGGRPGSIRRFEIAPGDPPDEALLPSRPAVTSHGTGVAEAIALGRALGRVPDRLVVHLVEGADFGEGLGLSSEVEAAVAEVAAHVIEELG
jgi:hydrogenase maturation protease